MYVQKDAVHGEAGILYTHRMRMDTDRRYGISVGDLGRKKHYRIITEGLKSGDEVVLQ